MKTAQLTALLGLLAATLFAASCGGYFHDDDDDFRDRDRDRGHKHDEDCDDRNTEVDAGITVPVDPADAAVRPDANDMSDAGESPDASEISDGGESPDATSPPECTSSAECAIGSQCIAGSCTPCAEGICACDRDDDCPGEQICNHPISTCEDRPVACAELSVEADCLARTDCLTIYGGMNCTDANGGECESGDVDCTCETFSFAACIELP